MLTIEDSAQSSHGETEVTIDIWADGSVTLVIANYIATVQLILCSLVALSEFEEFIRTSASSELSEHKVESANDVTVICSRQDSRVIFSILGKTPSGAQRHQIDIHLYGPRLTEFLSCLSEAYHALMSNQ